VRVPTRFSSVGVVVLPLSMVWMGVQARIALAVSFVVVAQALPGIAVSKLMEPNAPREYQVTVGTVLGVLFSTLLHVLVFEATGANLGWIVPLALLCVAATISPTTRRVCREVVLSGPRLLVTASLFVVTLAVLSRDFRWILWPSIAGLFTLLFLPNRRVSLVLGLLVTAAVGLFATRSRTGFWWFLTDDLQVFESVSFHFLRTGPGDVLGPLGELGGRYHVLTYQWTGLLAQISGAEPYVVLNRVTPVLLAVALAGLVFGYLTTQTALAFATRLLFASLFPLLINYSFVSPSYAAGVLVLLAGFRYWTTNTNRHVAVSSVISFVLSLSLALIKSSNIPVIVFGLGAVVAWSYRHDRIHLRIRSTDLCGAYAALALYAFLFLFNDRTTRQLDSFQLFGYAKQVLSEIDSLPQRPLRAAAALLVSAGLLALPSAVALWTWKYRKWTLTSVFAVAPFPFAVLMTVLSGNQANGYFVSSALNVMFLYALVIAGSLLESCWRSPDRRRIFAGLLSALIVSVLLWSLTREFNGGATLEIWMRVAENSALLGAAIGLMVTAVFVALTSPTRTLEGGVIGVVVLLLFASVTTREALAIQRLDKGPELSAGEQDQALGTNAERDIIERIRSRTPPNAVLATNRFCGEECRGSEWFDRDIALLGDDFNLPPTPSGFGGNNFRLSAESRRRVLIEGPRWLLVNGYPVDSARERMQATLDFAETASAESREALLRLGVTHFVLHLPSRLSSIPISSYGRAITSNDEFLVIDIG